MKKQIILILILTFFQLQSCYSQKAMQNLEEIDNVEIVNTKLSEQNAAIKNLEERIKVNETHKFFFSTNLKTQTGIFTVIVTFAIFIIGWLIPKHLKQEYELRITKLNDDLDSKLNNLKGLNSQLNNRVGDLITKISESEESINIEKENLNRHNSRTMFHISDAQNLHFPTCLWALRLVDSQLKYNILIDYDKNEKDKYISEYLEYSKEYAKKAIDNIEKIEDDRENLEMLHLELVEYTMFFKDKLTFEDDLKLIDEISIMVNKKYYELK